MDDIEGLRAALGASSDLDLAARLGIDRSAVAQWRRRGRVPPRYLELARDMLDGERRAGLATMRQLTRGLLLRDPVYAVWLAAALAVLPQDVFAPRIGETEKDRGERLERAVMAVVALIASITRDEFGRTRPEREDYAELIGLLKRERGAELLDDVDASAAG